MRFFLFFVVVLLPVHKKGYYTADGQENSAEIKKKLVFFHIYGQNSYDKVV